MTFIPLIILHSPFSIPSVWSFPHFTDKSGLAPYLQVGWQGEILAARHLRQLGYRVLQRNVRVGRRDEIDILAYDPQDNVLVFVEVKSRARSGLYAPEVNVTASKRIKMSRAARRWMARHDFGIGYRLDVVCVAEGKVVNHFQQVSGRR